MINMTECPECGGEGKLNVSDCCGAEPRGNGDNDSQDYGICPDCHQYCDYGEECEMCNGTGEIDENLIKKNHAKK